MNYEYSFVILRFFLKNYLARIFPFNPVSRLEEYSRLRENDGVKQFDFSAYCETGRPSAVSFSNPDTLAAYTREEIHL